MPGTRSLVICGALLTCALPASGQQQADTTAPTSAPVVDAREPRLVFEREVYDYPGRGRRDPFQPLTSANAGPLFQDLTVQMIIHTGDPRTSLVAVSDATSRVYRLRRGDSIGNATVVDIQPTRVVFSVSEFGVGSTQTLVMKGKEPR